MKVRAKSDAVVRPIDDIVYERRAAWHAGICYSQSIDINPLDAKSNYSVTSNNTKLVYWPLMGGLLHSVQRGGAWAGCGPAQSPPRCIPNVIAHPSTASVPIIVLLYDGSLLCGFNVKVWCRLYSRQHM